MKKIILFLLIMAVAVLADNYGSSTDGEYGADFAYFASNPDSTWWLFGYPDSTNWYDTVSGYQFGAYQYVDSIDLDSIGTHAVMIFAWNSGAVDDSLVGSWEHKYNPFGGGTKACTLIAHGVSGSDTILLNGAHPQVKSLDQTTGIVTTKYTDTSGELIVYLDSNTTYFVLTDATNYSQTTDSMTVTQDSSWDFYLTAFDPGQPTDSAQCIVYAYMGVPGDISSEGSKLRIVPRQPQGRSRRWVHSNGTIINPTEVWDISDTSGLAQQTVYQSAEVLNENGDSLKYDIVLEDADGKVFYSLPKYIVHTDSSSIWIRKRE